MTHDPIPDQWDQEAKMIVININALEAEVKALWARWHFLKKSAKQRREFNNDMGRS